MVNKECNKMTDSTDYSDIEDEYLDVSNQLLKDFNLYNMILFVGTDGDKVLDDSVLKLPWSCVLISSRDEGIDGKFTNDIRKASQYKQNLNADVNLPEKLFNPHNLPVINLYPKGRPSDNKGIEDMQADETMKKVLKHVDIRSRLIVIGYNPNNKEEYPYDKFNYLLKNNCMGKIILFNGHVQEDNIDLFKKNSNDSQFLWYDFELNEALDISNSQSIDNNAFTDDTDIIYLGNKAYAIDKNIILRSNNIAQLLNEDDIDSIRPNGKIQQSVWFYNFLYNSSLGPQWFGYQSDSEYYIKRSYEDTLVELVRNLLFGKNPIKSSEIANPVILKGAPGSSKSIELGALAYKIFKERMYPVIYIKNDNLGFSNDSPEFEQLTELMNEIDHVSNKNAKFLIIWDSSSYRDVSYLSNMLATQLHNIGRRFVLVCTAYGSKHADMDTISKEHKINAVFFRYKDGKFISSENDGDVLFDGKNYYVYADRQMSDVESSSLWNKAIKYSIADKNSIESIWKELYENGDNDLFDYLYRLILLIRPNLEEGLNKEQRKVNRYVTEQLKVIGRIGEIEDYSSNIMLEALKKANINISDEDKKKISGIQIPEDNISDKYNLDQFTLCIAMFSRFKLDTPYNLAINMLVNGKDFKFGSYTEEYLQLNDLITNSIPYLVYIQNSDGEFVFRFRNTLEAELWIERKNLDVDQEIDLCIKILDYYYQDYKQNDEPDINLKNSIMRFLRMIGPNSDYTQFRTGYNVEHQKLLKHMDSIIDRLRKLRKDYEIPDCDAGLSLIEITFTREYYGKQWDQNFNPDQQPNPWDTASEYFDKDAYITRAEKLNEACNLALSCIKDLQKQIGYNESQNINVNAIVSQINSLKVEACICNAQIDTVKEGYEKYCQHEGNLQDVGNRKKEVFSPSNSMSYIEQYLMLTEAIYTDPYNGYLYNALFNAFENEYNKCDKSDKRLQYLSEIMVIAEDVSNMDIHNRGMHTDELGLHLSKIFEYASSKDVSIDMIENPNSHTEFNNLFDSMLKKNNASAICFVCQKELIKANLLQEDGKIADKEVVLNNEQLTVCHRVISFMKKKDYAECIAKNQYALYLLLRVTWMEYDRRPLNGSKEKQLTYISKNGWKEINDICISYSECAGESVRPIVALLQALSTVQLNNDYIGGYRILKKLHSNQFNTNYRMRVPYILCDKSGKPIKFTGTVISVKNYSGYIQLDNFPKHFDSQTGVRFNNKNIGLSNSPMKNQMLKDLELGVSYTGYALFKDVESGNNNDRL